VPITTSITQVLELDISENMIESIESFGSLTTVSYLNINGNLLRNIEPRVFSNFKSLLELDLSKNNLFNLYNDTFSGLYRVQSLNLSCNNLTFIYTNLFNDLYDLRTLDLSFNRIISIEDGPFETLNYLNKLYLNGNEIKNIFTQPILTGLVRTKFIYTSADVDMRFESLRTLKKVFKLTEFKSLLETTYYKTTNIVFEPNTIQKYSETYCFSLLELVKGSVQLNLVDMSSVDKFLGDCVDYFRF
jgi:Leucine-rich repeat (LRR) protein